MKTARSIKSKIKTVEELEKLIPGLKSEGKKIVTTNGVFDILHAGHVSYLEEAGENGDVLIVGVNSDKSVRINKGDKRPINVEQSRLKVVAALESVDYALLFGEKDPRNWIAKIKPDFHVKAGDYKMEQIIEREVVESNGGKVIIANQQKGISTTKIINRIVDIYIK